MAAVAKFPETEDSLRLEEAGCIVIKNVVSPEICDAIRQHVWASTDEAVRQGRNDLLGNIQEQHCRWDLKLELCRPVIQALLEFREKVGPTLQAYMKSAESGIKVVELAAITSDSGAVSQAVHADTMHGVTRFLQSDIELPDRDQCVSDDEDAPEDVSHVVRAVATDTAILMSAQVALQDIVEEMGPTHVWQGTHTVEHHATLWSAGVGRLTVEGADEAFKIPHKKMVMNKGDLILYDSRVMHCGGANYSTPSRRRSIMTISTMSPGIRPDGSTFTMLSALKNKYRLAQLLLLKPDEATATVSTADCVQLPPRAEITEGSVGFDAEKAFEGKDIPPLEEWEASCQCTTCRQWRAVPVCDAPRFAMSTHGFNCKDAGFVCTQPQKYTKDQIDEALD